MLGTTGFRFKKSPALYLKYSHLSYDPGGRIARSGLGHVEYRVPWHFIWRQPNHGRVLGARQLGGFASFLALGFASFLAPAISRETNECV